MAAQVVEFDSLEEQDGPDTRTRRSEARRTSLGFAILHSAIGDYRGKDEFLHSSAAQFLYPTNAMDRDHLHWCISLCDGVDPAWLRQELDRSRPGWDAARCGETDANRMISNKD